MATMKQRIGAGIAGLFILAGNAVAQNTPQPNNAAPAASAPAVKKGAFNEKDFNAQVAAAMKAEQERLAKTPRLQQQLEEGSKFCGKTADEMLGFRLVAAQFARFDKATDKVFFTEVKDGKRVEVNVTEEDFGKRATKVPQRGTPNCGVDYWSAQAINDATELTKSFTQSYSVAGGPR